MCLVSSVVCVMLSSKSKKQEEKQCGEYTWIIFNSMLIYCEDR